VPPLVLITLLFVCTSLLFPAQAFPQSNMALPPLRSL
jgi:hypothetical protein